MYKFSLEFFLKPTPLVYGTFCESIVVATHKVRLFILSTSRRIFTALCLYFGFCHAYKMTMQNNQAIK